jgi:hypothetical protein
MQTFSCNARMYWHGMQAYCPIAVLGKCMAGGLGHKLNRSRHTLVPAHRYAVQCTSLHTPST